MPRFCLDIESSLSLQWYQFEISLATRCSLVKIYQIHVILYLLVLFIILNCVCWCFRFVFIFKLYCFEILVFVCGSSADLLENERKIIWTSLIWGIFLKSSQVCTNDACALWCSIYYYYANYKTDYFQTWVLKTFGFKLKIQLIIYYQYC